MACGAIPGAASAQTALLVVAHGGSTEWNDQVRETMRQVRWAHGPASVAFLMGEERLSHGWSRAAGDLRARGATSVIVVPLMVSSWGSHVRQAAYYAGLRPELPAELHEHAGDPPAPLDLPAIMTAALDTAPELGEALRWRWRELSPRARRAPLILLAHGPNEEADAQRWLTALNRVVRPLREEPDPPPAVQVALLRDDAPAAVRAAAVSALRDSSEALARRWGDSVTVMTILIAQGELSRQRIPSDLTGLPVRYAPAGLTPLPALARWIERVAGEALREASGG